MPFVVALALPLLALALAPVSMAQDKVVAKVNGKNLTESDLKYAEAEIGADIGNLPEATRRRVLVEYLIENQLFADAAETQKLGSGTAFDERLQYWRRRALRETYFDASVKSAVSEADARKLYDEQVAQIAKAKPEEEVKASHILVKEEDKAKEIVAAEGRRRQAFAESHANSSIRAAGRRRQPRLFGRTDGAAVRECLAQKGEVSALI
jgi:peptidyl-prolyl cis-trans isomerase C